VNTLWFDAANRLYIGTNGKGTQVLEAGAWKIKSAATVRASRVYALARTSDGALFSGTKSGVIETEQASGAALRGQSASAGVGTFDVNEVVNASLQGAAVKHVAEVNGEVFSQIAGVGAMRLDGFTGKAGATPKWNDANEGLDDDVSLMASNKSKLALLGTYHV
jgi:hypothetical protein